MVDAHQRRRPARRSPAARCAPSQVVAVRMHRPVGQHRAGRRRRPAGRRLHHVDGQPRRAVTSGTIIGGPVAGLRARSRCRHGCARPAARRRRRRRPDRPHAATSQHDEPEVAERPRAGTSSRSTTSRCGFTGVAAASHASMTAAWLTDNRAPRPLAYDDELVRRAGVDAAKLPPLRRPVRSSAPCAPTSPPTSACPPACRSSPATPDLHSAACRRRRRPRLRDAHGDQHDLVDQLRRCRSRRPTSSTDRERPRRRRAAAT